MVLIFATTQSWVLALLVDRPFVLPALPITWIALAWLGLLGSCVAYLLYFTLINSVGATRAAVVTYVFPVVGLVLGVLIRNEPVDWRLLLGTALIVAGIVVINVKLNLRRQPQVAPASAGE
jgi:drug/metabolite transporter (DMT)-like permease